MLAYFINFYFKYLWKFAYKIEQIDDRQIKNPLYFKLADWAIWLILAIDFLNMFILIKKSATIMNISILAFTLSIVYFVFINFKLHARKYQIKTHQLKMDKHIENSYDYMNDKIFYYNQMLEKQKLNFLIKNKKQSATQKKSNKI
jgi:hypothetical protein